MLQRLPRKVFFDWLETHPAAQKQYSRFPEGLLVGEINRELNLLINSPKERLERLLARSSQVFQEIPAKYIASYLRMAPETLSRLMKS